MADFNSKYTGEQVDALLDIVSQGGVGGGGGEGEVQKTTEAEITAMGFTKNLGTITEVKMNGVTKGTSGVVDLGTVITAHQDISGKADSSSLAKVATSGSYNDLSNKPTIPAAVTESTVSGWGFTKNKGTYSKPSTGIPKTDLASAVQTSLGKADTALQSYTEQYKGTVTKVKINGSEKTPDANGLVDLGTISGGSSSSGGSGAYAEVNHGTSDTTFTLTPNTFHIWDEVSSLTLALGSETTGIANEFLFQFTSGATATSLSLPDNIKWANDSAPTIAENMIYQVSILKGLASVLEFSNEVNIFPMYFTTPDSGYMEANEQSIALADYVLNNAVFDGAAAWDCYIPEKSVYIDGHEVNRFDVLSKDKDSYPYQWMFSDGYDYDYFMFVSAFYVTGEQKGQMERWDDD